VQALGEVVENWLRSNQDYKQVSQLELSDQVQLKSKRFFLIDSKWSLVALMQDIQTFLICQLNSRLEISIQEVEVEAIALCHQAT